MGDRSTAHVDEPTVGQQIVPTSPGESVSAKRPPFGYEFVALRAVVGEITELEAPARFEDPETLAEHHRAIAQVEDPIGGDEVGGVGPDRKLFGHRVSEHWCSCDRALYLVSQLHHQERGIEAEYEAGGPNVERGDRGVETSATA